MAKVSNWLVVVVATTNSLPQVDPSASDVANSPEELAGHGARLKFRALA